MKLRIPLMASILVLATQAAAAPLGNNRVFLEVWNGQPEAAGKSYIRDLGIPLDAFLDAPECYQRVLADLSADDNLAGLKTDGALPAGAVWSVLAVNADGFASLSAAGNDPQDPRNQTGILATVANPADLQDLQNTYPSFPGASAAIKLHLDSAGVSGTKAFAATDPGYYLEAGVWDDLMNGNVGFASTKKVSAGGSLSMYFLTVDGGDFATGVVGRNGNALGDWSFDGNKVSFTTHTPTPDSCPKPAPCTLPWGGQIDDGQSVAAYKSSVDANCAANKETRICGNGTLSGDYTFSSCAAPVACDLPWGGKLESGKSVTAYQTGVSADCNAIKETRTCDNGTLSGANTFQSCAAPACDLPWGGKLESGKSVTAYQTGVSADCDAVKETRTCDKGVLSGANTFQSCTAPAACDLPWGGKLESGQSITAYQVGVSADCESVKETRTCDNGVLSGANTFQSCSAPAACELPWGGQIASGESVTAYQSDKSPNCDEEKETRTCDNGNLSGLYSYSSCSVSAYGPYVKILAPNGGEAWRSRSHQYLEWTSVNIDSNKRLNLFFSKDGGKTWKLVRKGLPAIGRTTWKPGKKRLTGKGLLAVCLPLSKTSLAKCDKSDAVFSIVK